MVGVIHTKTNFSVRLAGESAPVAGATEQQAGAMTAEHVRMLNQVYDSLLVDNSNYEGVARLRNADRTNLFGSSAPAVGEMSLPPSVEVLPPNHGDDLARRVVELEKRTAGVTTREHTDPMKAVTTLRDNVAKRIAEIEKRLAALEAKVVANDNAIGTATAPEEVDALRREVEQLRVSHDESAPLLELIQRLVNDPTPVFAEETP